VRWASHRLGQTTASKLVPGESQVDTGEVRELGFPAFSRYLNKKKFIFG
jgi:hypothetical protein